MGRDKVRHVATIKGHQYWIPSPSLRALGYSSERLPDDPAAQLARAAYLNAQADKDRDTQRVIDANPLPPNAVRNLATLFLQACRQRVADGDLSKRTLDDYEYDMGAIVAKWGRDDVNDLTAKIMSEWLKAVRRENVWTAYHLGLVMRTFLKWCHVEQWLSDLPVFVVTKPASRRVKWDEPEIIEAARRLSADGYASLSVGLLIEWCIGQNPGDVWSLRRSHYAGGRIDLTRGKTGVGGDPIPLWPDVRAELERYLEENPATPDAPLLRCEFTGKEWVESTRCKKFAQARDRAPAMRRELQMRDLRRTAASEAIGLGASRDEARTLTRHATAQGLDPYVEMTGTGAVDRVQQLRFNARQTKTP